jgi:hypothetical protein
MAREIKRGDRLKVVDVDGPKTAKGKLPFALGAELVCIDVRPAHVAVKGHPGWYKAHRFEVVRG